MNRVSTRGDQKNDACGGLRLCIPILQTIFIGVNAEHHSQCNDADCFAMI
ncbi:hypothetical protein [Nostoc sp. UCD121]|nr:hypothetical protein [Nostoc sp. UCD121]MBC1223394.1 hypothetical protein [Nostoc sp. UCD120]